MYAIGQGNGGGLTHVHKHAYETSLCATNPISFQFKKEKHLHEHVLIRSKKEIMELDA